MSDERYVPADHHTVVVRQAYREPEEGMDCMLPVGMQGQDLGVRHRAAEDKGRSLELGGPVHGRRSRF